MKLLFRINAGRVEAIFNVICVSFEQRSLFVPIKLLV